MPDATPRVIFRADGNSTMGLGHVVRCLALAAMLQPDFECIFAIHAPEPQVQAQIQAVCRQVWRIPAFPEKRQEADWLLAQLQPTDILVLDGYHFGPGYDHTFWARQQPVVWLDDVATQFLWADMVINHAGGISPDTYADNTVPGAERCLGPAYALLRQPFQLAAQQPVAQPDTGRIFLNMGGADPENHTLALLKQLRHQFPEKNVEVVTGAAYPHQAELEQQTQGLPGVILHHNITAGQLAEILRRCGLHVCPPSGMAYECCAVGGLLLLHSIAGNQHRLFSYLTANSLARPYTDLLEIEDSRLPTLARESVQRQRQVFDGAAGPRFRRVFAALHTTGQLTVRRARAADAAQYFAWANDPDVRRNAIQTEPIEWATHLGWFSRRLADADSVLYVLEQAGVAVGQVRIEFMGSEGTIDYSVAASRRGQGLGVAILRRALGQLRRDNPAAWTLLGQVKSGNLASCRVFQRLGFTPAPAVRLHDEHYDVFRLAVAAAPVF
ncbi:UDP-2,4-diacetamido-2,4,6-trideoxy-beta-L-altropyranose hydrolase [Hymenobacter elongatus]|uniref:UDP-2,4-diacetamido-2,4, 6-trideoxy-beta-L-altropyranose hydrolase n=1 Tax=Hymenobacter elongatus TaxID=877208 RepID=A0A4Z0PJB6_9BACT|nr:UDP-2,4-diacetamido-2,4,6-trideoxy-beta-L-altropyranose hydrolase [Hymenobacter elongatus]TGE15461.1 UDP-2,4-diacetamido-2,4,6-trideoxy-beta-L-altropyranose hydrolase [Hymenobacter elongatus]